MQPGRYVRRRSTAVGAGLIAAGAVLLLVLRFAASPIARRITGAEPAGFVEFLGIPVFFVVVLLGMGLFLWRPGEAP